MKTAQLCKRMTLGLVVATTALGTIAEDMESRLDEVPGNFNLESRLRYEVFDQAGGLDVDGVSHRIRVGYTTPESGGFQGMIEGETLYAWGHGRDLHPADNAGDGTDLNQLWLAYRNEDLGSVKLGRQLYTLDDHRFVGHVGWRQNIQTFDAVTGSIDLIEGLSLKAFFIDAVNTVTDMHNDIEAFGLNAGYALNQNADLVLFYYAIDGSPDAAGSSSDTLGVRLTGKLIQNELTWAYALSAARQWENSGFPGVDFGHDYLSADLSVDLEGVTIGGGVELLGGNGIHGFSTPLATLHKFNGFADVFLGASGSGGLVNGLEDYQLYAGYTFRVGNGIKTRLIHHWFKPWTGSGDYGEELDLVASYQINERFSVLGKYGDYNSDGGSGGVGGSDKTLLTVELNFVY
ncbi:alginate export family protein [Puniceicoccales bacterium CK1056]|uniref:Alginate export family protein n=1 Tax=Oceanipulchritudo coccoides TaxID=2706888 RepID=A0A6B2LY48_9BACT|nr:alginate export family protein [Oceanipulchritudo coccoides]NDV61263.1 alginate export family protein [Oceanipulchritudo coccoides]